MRRIKNTLQGWLCGVIPALLFTAVPAEAAEVARRLGVMGTDLSIRVSAPDRETALIASEAVVRTLEEAERRLSTWTDRSELAHLNAAPIGIPYAVSATLAAELQAAQTCALQTGGAFDPTAGPLVAAWDLRGAGRIPGSEELANARRRVGFRGYSVAATSITKHSAIQFEEGAFGKGAGLAGALRALHSFPVTDVVIDLGGQVVTRNETIISVAHPQRRNEEVLRLRIPPGSFATSGNSENGKQVDGVSVGHILDPRAGTPAPNFGTIGVWSRDPQQADCLSTALFVLGPERALRWAAQHPEVGVVILEPASHGQVRLRYSSMFANRLVSTDGSVIHVRPAR